MEMPKEFIIGFIEGICMLILWRNWDYSKIIGLKIFSRIITVGGY